MPFNAVLVASAANISAVAWQQLASLPPPERISGGELVDLVIGFPLRQIGRWALCVWTYLCFSPHPNHHFVDYTSDDGSDGGRGGASSSRYRYGGQSHRRFHDYSSSDSD